MSSLDCCLRNHPGTPSDVVIQHLQRSTARGKVTYTRPFCRICKAMQAQEMKRTGSTFATQPAVPQPYGVVPLNWPVPGREHG